MAQVKRKPVVKINPAEFVREYRKNGNNATRAVKILDPEKSQRVAEVKGERLLRNSEIQHLLKGIEDKIKRNAALAITRQAALIQSDNEPVAASMVKDALDRAGFKPSDKVETISSINISFGLAKPQDVQIIEP